MSPKNVTTRRSSSLRQGTLSFASMKRTSSTASGGKLKIPAVKTPSKRKTNADESSEEEDSDGVESTLSDEEDVPAVEEKAKVRTPISSKSRLGSNVYPKENIESLKPEEKPPLPDLNPKDSKWRKQYAHAKEQMNGFQPIHGKDQNRVHEILRIFDLSYQYGPCLGVTRLERWERANALGLNPPSEIKEILNTRQGVEEAQYLQCVFYDEV